MTAVTRRDLALLAFFTAALGALLAPALLRPGWALANFGDVWTYHFPLRHLAASSVAAGRLPFWNAYIFGGLPLLANSQSVLLYPPAALGRMFSTLNALDWEQAFHLWWAGVGFALLARRSGLRALEAWLLGGLYALSPMLVYRVTEGIPTLLAALAWAPWCWLAWASGRRGWLGLCWALQFLGGHPQFLLANAAAMGVAAVLRKDRLVQLPRLAVEGGIALALAAAQWLPTWEFLANSVRANWPLAFSLGYSVGAAEAASLVAPAPFGDPVTGTWAGPPSVFFETHALYLGALLPAVALVGLLRGKRALPLSLLALGAFFAAGAHNPLYAKLLEKTALGFLRTPSRWLFCCVLGLLFAAGAGLKALRADGRRALWARLALGAALLLELVVWDLRFVTAQEAGPFVTPNEALKQQIGDAPYRVLTDPGLANPNKTMLYRAMNVNGYEAFYLGGFAPYAARSEGGPAADASRSYLTKLETPEMRRLAVSYKLRSDAKIEPAKRALPLAYGAKGGEPVAGRLLVSRPRAERWVVSGAWPAGADRVVLSMPAYPGWRMLFNGEPLRPERWDAFLQAARPAAAPADGERFVLEARFAPTGWPLWAAATAAAWLWLFGCCVTSGRQAAVARPKEAV